MIQVARGTNDIYGLDAKKWRAVEDIITQITTVYDYSEIRTPIFEHTEVFKRENDSSDMVNKEMYTFTDNGGRSLTLRPEGTAGVVRSFVENKMYGNSADLPLKLYYRGPMFRYERPQKGRMRQFNQFGVEVIGAKSAMLDVECIAMGYTLLKALGINSVTIHINTLGDDESRANYRTALKNHFENHIAEMCSDCKRRFVQNPLRLLDCKVDAELDIMKSAPKMSDYLNEESKAYFEEVKAGLDALEIPYVISDKLVRGLDYYSHTVFEAIADSETLGSKVAVFGGGRYDKLVEYFEGPALSGVGFAAGMECLIMMAEAEGNELASEDGIDAYVMCLSPSAQIKALELTTMLRASGYIANMDVQNRSFKAQFKSVARYNAKFAIIIGEDELAQGVVNVKHIASQEQVTIPYDSLIDHLDAYFVVDGEATCNCGSNHQL